MLNTVPNRSVRRPAKGLNSVQSVKRRRRVLKVQPHRGLRHGAASALQILYASGDWSATRTVQLIPAARGLRYSRRINS